MQHDASTAAVLAVHHVPLDVDGLRSRRAGSRFGGVVHYAEALGSTNDRARELAVDGAAEGTVVIAERQTHGRGRLGRSWVSPPYRNLYVSIVLRPPIPAQQAPQLALIVGLATAETVRVWTDAAGLKWPNDVVIGGRKVSGILTEMEAAGGDVRFVIAGIGVNLNSVAADFPPELRDRAMGLCTAAGGAVDRAAFAAELLARIEARYETYLTMGFAALRPAWESLSCLHGRPVRVVDGARPVEGVVAGLTESGALRLVDAAGRETCVLAGDVTVVDGYADLRG
ncbi:biotin--[acetyl-CoA-carboxylase] ligase [Candidatus Binatia bacterium]|nr:biotin--[acetyl-CoA-carboxylase] ligase [Candidatus Binatia bacterium]